MQRFIQTLLLAALVAPAWGAVRRRAVAPPAPASIFVPAVEATTLTLTNYDSTPARITACAASCVTEVLAPHATGTYNVEPGLIQLFSVSDKLEARTRALDGVRRADLLMDKATLPVYDTTSYTQTLRVFADISTSVDLVLLGSNGVQEGVRSLSVHPGYTDFNVATFGTLTGGKQLELRPKGAVGAFLIRTDQSGKSMYLPAQQNSRASGENYLLGVQTVTFETDKNLDPAHILGVGHEFYPANTEVRTPPPPNARSIINYGVDTIDLLAETKAVPPGAVFASGARQVDGSALPFLPWAWSSSTQILPISKDLAAVARSNFGSNVPSDTIQMYNDEISNVQPDDTIHVMQALIGNTPTTAEFATVTGHLNGYNNQGDQIVSYPITLRGKEYLYRRVGDVLPGASRVELELDIPPAGTFLTPMAVMTSTTPAGYTHVGYRTERAAPVAVPSYEVTATIRVRDNGQTFEQTTHPAMTTVQKLLNVNNPDALVGSHGFDCTPAPDPVVNSIPELLANYEKLTSAEQQEFSGDRAGFAPFAANGCDASATQYVLFIAIVVKRPDAPGTGEQYEMATDLTVWSNGQALHTSGTTRDQQYMAILTGSTNIAPFVGFNVYDHNSPRYQDLQDKITRIKAQFTLDDYKTVFNDTATNLTPFFTDTDGDGYVIDCGAADWQYDNGTSAPSNQPNGIIAITYDIKTVAPEYELTTDLFVVDATGQPLVTTGRTRDERLIKLVLNTTTLRSALLGTYVQDNGNPSFHSLQVLIDRLKTNLGSSDYRALFDEDAAKVLPFFTDTDADGYCIDILPNGEDWQYDNTTPSPGNNAQGTTRIQWKLTLVP